MRQYERLGAHYLGNGAASFGVWAPFLNQLSLHLFTQEERLLPLEKQGAGYFFAKVEGVLPKDRYVYRLESGKECADPFSFFQPEGVDAPSELVDHGSFSWQDSSWQGVVLQEMILYELHVGTCTQEGTFTALISRLSYLKELGITAIELMPVAQFPGDIGWGYDGAFPFAVHSAYGGPQELKTLVNACHKMGIGVVLDVVYNHLGPEGCPLVEFMPCLTDVYTTPWGQAINFDQAYSDGVREYFIQNALYWFEEYHIDALRLDAIHGIVDRSAKPFLQQLQEEVVLFSKQKGRAYYLLAESDLNDVRVITPVQKGGYGLAAQWNDDFHHALHSLLTKEKAGYYEDFGSIFHLKKAVEEGFVYTWQYSSYRKRFHGSSSFDVSPIHLIIFSQNHDQVGNRMKGERLASLVDFQALKVAAALVILSRNIPLLFMGEEYGEETPFLYFTSFCDQGMKDRVREGRRKGFFPSTSMPPDPFDKHTFLSSKVKWDKKDPESSTLLVFYTELISLRKRCPSITRPTFYEVVVVHPSCLLLHGALDEQEVFLAYNLGEEEATVNLIGMKSIAKKILDSSDRKWRGCGSKINEAILPNSLVCLAPMSVVLFGKNI